jgi:MFS family permease
MSSTASDPTRAHYVSPYAWWVVIVLAIALLVSYVDRQILALVVEPMKADLGYSDTQVGWLYGGFAIFYALAGVPIAYLVDSRSRKGLIAWGIFLWSLATMACGMVRGFWALFAARIGVGAGEATVMPATYSMLGDLMPRQRLPLALGIFQVGAIVGSGLAFVVGGYVVSWVRHAPPVTLPLIGEVFSWQMTFIYVGLPGLLVLLLFMTIREPARRHSKVHTSQAPAGTWAQVWEFYRVNAKALIPHHLGFTCLILIGYAFVFWSPSFFERVHGMPAEEASIIYGFIFIIAGGSGSVFAGLMADRLARRGRADGPLVSAIFGVSLFLPIVVAIQFVPNLTWVFILYAPALFMMNMPFGMAHGALAQITPAEIRGRVAAVYTLVTSVGNAIGPPIAGFLSDDVFTSTDGVRYSIMTMVCVFGGIGLTTIWFGRRHFAAALTRAAEQDEAI